MVKKIIYRILIILIVTFFAGIGKSYGYQYNLDYTIAKLHSESSSSESTEIVLSSYSADIEEDTNDASDRPKGLLNTVKETWKFVTNKPLETFITIVFNQIVSLSDTIQSFANKFDLLNSDKITYMYDELEEEGIQGTNNKYTNVGEYQKSGTWKKVINIDGTKQGFTEETEIPVIRVDLYNIAIGNIDILDINFLNGQSKHQEESAWMTFRNFTSAVLHVVLYLSLAILITILIWHGLNLVKGSLTPSKVLKHKEGLERFAKSLLMIIGTIIIMALSIFGSNMFLDEVKMENEDELPIRVNVKSAEYSFSTNITGYVRYIAGIENVDAVGEKVTYALIYFVLVIINFVVVLFMVGRMIVMLVLAIVGPIVAVLYAFNKEKVVNIKYKAWAKLYIALASVQIFFAIAYRALLEII